MALSLVSSALSFQAPAFAPVMQQSAAVMKFSEGDVRATTAPERAF